MNRPPGLRVGLTGGIGSGKSTAAGILAGFGARIVDADAISRELTEPGGEALPALRATFGDRLFDATGALDRRRMRELVFGDEPSRRRLEAVLHPMIRDEMLRRAATIEDAAPIVFDIPLLAESPPWLPLLDRVLVIDCSEATQVERVRERSGWTSDMARSVVARQASRERRRAIADAVILNDGIDRMAFAARLNEIWALWTGTGEPSARP